MKDTVDINPVGAYVLEQFFSRKDRLELFQSWAGSASLWVKGGNFIWGNMSHAPDDYDDKVHTHGQFLTFKSHSGGPKGDGGFLPSINNMTVSETESWILERAPPTFQRMITTNYSFGFERDEDILERNDLDPRKWTNPLEVRLPEAPSMKLFCVYGHGKETERSYWYVQSGSKSAPMDNASVCEESALDSCVESRKGSLSPLYHIDATHTNENIVPKVRNGIGIGEGDGTVSLLSLGAMCVEGWKRSRWNPAGIKISTVELPHRPDPAIPRGGAETSDHVDILGSTELNEIILKVAAGAGHEIRDTYVSNIREYSKKIQWD